MVGKSNARRRKGRWAGDEGRIYREFFLGLFLWMLVMGAGAYFITRLGVV